MNENQPTQKTCGRFLIFLLLLAGSLAVLCHDGFRHNYTFWSNDGPLGFMNCKSASYPGAFLGHWSCESWIGGQWPSASPNIDAWIACLVSPIMFLKIFTPISMLVFGFSIWLLFRQLNFGAPVCVLGGLAAGLNMHYFSVACWGLGQWCLAAAMMALAMSAIVSPHIRQFWAKALLAGLAVGMGVMEGFDVGAILSVFVGVFVVYYFWITETNKGAAIAKVFGGGALVVLFSLLIAASTIWGLYGTQIVGVNSMSGDTPEAAVAKWEFNTTWSTPKIETLGVFVSGLFGYRMQEYMTDSDKSSAYWGLQGELPLIDQLESSDPKVRAEAGMKIGGAHAMELAQLMESNDLERRHDVLSQVKRSGMQLRHTGSGEYAGVTVALLALLGLINSFRGERSLLTIVERKLVWFFGAAAAVALLSAWGRYSFLYGAFWFRLPLISTIRSTIKFMHPFDVLLIILAGFGMEALYRRYQAGLVGKAETMRERLMDWWNGSDWSDKVLTLGSFLLIACGVTAFVLYSRAEPKLTAYLEDNGFGTDLAPGIAAFSVKSAFWGLFFLVLSVAVSLVLWLGGLSEKKSLIGWGLLAAILIIDLGRSDAAWVRYYDVGKKYSENLVVNILKDKPWEHRVVGRTSPMGGYDLSSDGNLGSLDHWWMENDYPYNNIQNLEIDQQPRMQDMESQYLGRFGSSGGNIVGGARLWRLTNTKYILCDASIIPVLSTYADPVNHSFHAVGMYRMIPKEWIPDVERDGQMVPAVEDAGDLTFWPADQKLPRTDYFTETHTNVFALVQYDSALPRAKLYANWVTLDDPQSLNTVADPSFDVNQSVVVSKSTPVDQASGLASADPGTVNITDYESKDVKLDADAKTPAVMLLNDRYLPPDDNVGRWKVFVDDKEATLLRCNYIMRGVFLTAGHHTIEFHYKANLRYLYVTLLAFLAGFLTAGYVIYTKKTQSPAPEPFIDEQERESKPQRA